MDSISSFLGLAKKAGNLAVGEEPVGAACRARKARVVLTASDTAPNSLRRASHFAQAGGEIPLLTIPLDKAAVGNAVGLSSCAMLAVTDIGMAAALVKKLAVLDPDTYGTDCARLELKSLKALQRRKEKHAHEKNMAHGKKKSQAPQSKHSNIE